MSKVDHSVGENIYMLPSDMNIRSGTVRYNNKILVSNSGFSLGKNDMINSSESENSPVPKVALTKVKSHKNLLQKGAESTIMHEEEKAALIVTITGDLTKWFMSLINRNFVYHSTQSPIRFCILWYAESHSVIRLINSLLRNLLH